MSIDTRVVGEQMPGGVAARVLVVDDDRGIRGFIEMMLRAEGYDVTTATNGQEGLSRVAEQRPDVVLLDLSMPVMTGWEFHQRLRERAPGVPVVYMTAGYSARVEAEQHGADGYLSKPFEVEDLLARVAQFTAQRQT